ncbi:MAG: hypothetical protein WC822_01565 [Candidatus Paceibacterota bacterium]|jgi:hypothetical protein
MSTTTIFSGQGVAKDCIVGDRLMNRYGVFNGLELPRRIDRNLAVTLLGFTVPAITSVTSVAGGGSLVASRWYSYKAVYASAEHTRPVAVADASLNYSRGNPSAQSSQQNTTGAASRMTVIVPGSTNTGVTHVLLYRSKGQTTQAAAEAGPWYYVAQGANDTTGGNVTITEGVADASVGVAAETDNYAPSAWRYAVAAFGYIFAGGNFPLGEGFTCTVTPGSSLVVANSSIFYDGISDWSFKLVTDNSGGVDDHGTFYCDYVNATTIRLVDGDGTAMNYDGTGNGAGYSFKVWLPGNVLRWSKNGEPESWPATNLINFEGDISGIGQLPNSSLLLVCTDSPSIWIMDMTLTGTAAFKTSKRMISSERTATSHYSLCGVDGRLRGIDAHQGCIWESDGVSVADVTKFAVPKIWMRLERNENSIKNWHCAYDPRQHIFGAFVTFANSHRLIDFCIGQHTITKGWFFNFEKDLLCTGSYVDPQTGEAMVLGGTQGIPTGGGAVWGRIWCPNHYDEWVPDNGTLRSGTILSATATVLTVDNTTLNLHTVTGGLSGRWVLVCDANGENAQMGYISSNTAGTITVSSVINSVSSTQFNPVPVAGWKFYIGLIELRWGPKYFDFSDPDNEKKVLEVLLVMEDYNTADLPFIRVFRGKEMNYTVQNALTPSLYRDGATHNEGLFSRYTHHVEPGPRWGVSVIDRCYDETKLSSLTVVFQTVNARLEKP